MTFDSGEEGMQIQIESVLDCSAVDFGNEATGSYQRGGINAGRIADTAKFQRGAARVRAFAAADVNPDLALDWSQSALQGADNARGDAGRMPVHAHDCPEGLKPKRVRESAQKFISAIFVHDGFRNNAAQGRHAG
jgi:hypothetical protein